MIAITFALALGVQSNLLIYSCPKLEQIESVIADERDGKGLLANILLDGDCRYAHEDIVPLELGDAYFLPFKHNRGMIQLIQFMAEDGPRWGIVGWDETNYGNVPTLDVTPREIGI